MLKKLSRVLVVSCCFISGPALAMMHSLQPGMSVQYKLPPNDPQVFSNFLFWQIKAKCTIKTSDDNDPILAEVIKKHGYINQHELHEHDSFSFDVQNQTILEITADSGAKVQLINLGSSTITADCETT